MNDLIYNIERIQRVMDCAEEEGAGGEGVEWTARAAAHVRAAATDVCN